MSATATQTASSATQKLLARIENMGTVEEVPINELHFDQTYQRDLRTNFAQEIAAQWDTMALGLPLVSRRKDGTMYVVNGQHRVAAASLLGLPSVVCMIVTGLSQEQEAELRLHGNVQLPENSLERFKAKVAARQQAALEIIAICEQFETIINPSPSYSGGINAIAAVERIYHQDRGVTLVRVFEMLKDAFGQVGGTYTTSPLLKAIAWFLRVHGSEFNRARFVERLQVVGPAGLERMARNTRAAMGGSLWMNYYRALVELYNEKLGEGSRLEWKTGGWTTSGLGPNGGNDWSD